MLSGCKTPITSQHPSVHIVGRDLFVFIGVSRPSVHIVRGYLFVLFIDVLYPDVSIVSALLGFYVLGTSKIISIWVATDL